MPALGAIGFAAGAFVPGPMAAFGLDNPVGLVWVPRSVGDGPLGEIPILAGTVIAVASLVMRYRGAGTIERAQIRWLLLPVFAFFAVLLYGVTTKVLLGEFDPYVGGSFLVLAQLVLPISMGIAILRDRLFDIDLIINRTIVYGATSTAIAVAFFGGIVALQSVLRLLTSGSEIAVGISTLLSFGLFRPIRRGVQDAVDRRFDHSRYDAARTLELFADRLRDEVDLDALRADLLGAVRQTMGPAHASLWLRKRESRS